MHKIKELGYFFLAVSLMSALFIGVDVATIKVLSNYNNGNLAWYKIIIFIVIFYSLVAYFLGSVEKRKHYKIFKYIILFLTLYIINRYIYPLNLTVIEIMCVYVMIVIKLYLFYLMNANCKMKIARKGYEKTP